MNSSIRIRYSSVIMYLAKSISFVTGALFLILISRKLGIEVGLWQLLMSYVSVSLLPRSIINFWVTRYTSRGFYTVKDSIIAMLIASLVGSMIYYFSILTTTSFFVGKWDLVILGNIFLLMTYLSSLFGIMAFSRAPQATGFSLSIFELSKVGLLLYLYLYFTMNIASIMVILITARLLEFSFIVLRYRSIIFSGIKPEQPLWTKWIFMSWVPLLLTLPVYISYVDKLIVSGITNSYEPIAYFSIAFALAGLVSQTTSVVSVLYPKLLQSGGENDIIITFKLTFFFSLPILPLVLVSAEQIIQVFGYEFVAASLVARVLIIAEILVLFDNILNSILLGLEKVDANINFSFRDIFKSMLFKVPLLNNLMIVSYLVLLGVTVSLLWDLDPLYVSLVWAIVYIAYRLALVLSKFTLSRRSGIRFGVPWGSIGRYFLAAGVASIVLFFMPKVTRELRLLEFVILYAPYLATYLGVYVGISVMIEKEARYLLERTISILTGKIKKS